MSAKETHVWRKRTGTSEKRMYALQLITGHLLRAGQIERLHELLCNYSFLQDKVSAFGPTALIGDYELALRHHEGLAANDSSPEIYEQLRFVRDTLRLMEYVLLEDRTQLAGQLTGRLSSSPSKRVSKEKLSSLKRLLARVGPRKDVKRDSFIKSLLSGIEREDLPPWLRPLTNRLLSEGGPLLYTLASHDLSVDALAITPDGRIGVSGSSSLKLKTLNSNRGVVLKVWDLQQGNEMQTLHADMENIKALSITPDGRFLAAADGEGFIKVWDMNNGVELRTLKGPSYITTLAISADGLQLVCGGDYGVFVLWDLDSGAVVRSFGGGGASAMAVSMEGNRCLSGCFGGSILIWDLARGRQLHNLVGHGMQVSAVALTTDGWRAASVARDGTLKIWNVEHGEEIFSQAGFNDTVFQIALTPGGGRLILGSNFGPLTFYDLKNKTVLRFLKGHTDAITGVVITADGHLAFVAADEMIVVWDMREARVRRLLNVQQDAILGAATPDGRLAIFDFGSGPMAIWEPEARQGLRYMAYGGIPARWGLDINALAITQDGRRAVSLSGGTRLSGLASVSSTLTVWDTVNGQAIANLTGDHTFLSCAIASDGRTICAGDESGNVHFFVLEGAH